jgi:peptidoglycan-associated lipoprotein
MIRRPRGRPAWIDRVGAGRYGKVVVGMRTWWTWRVALAFLLVIPLAGACKKKGPHPGEAGAGGAGAGLGEEGLGAGGSSLERTKRGLAPEEDGILGDVHFAYDSFEIDSAGREVLTRNLDWLRKNSRAKVELEGHADSRGTIEYNLALGAKRAKAVKDALVAQGIAADRLSTISYGKELPLCHEENETCWARNRRVHSVIIGQ